MKKLIIIILITAATAKAQNFEERLAHQILCVQNEQQALDCYWAERGYHREGNVYREGSKSCGTSVESYLDTHKAIVQQHPEWILTNK